MKHASVALIALTVLCSVSGCAGRQPDKLPAAPLILNLPDCPEPGRPWLPAINGNLPFDAPENIEALLERDDILRFHIKAWEATGACYRRQPTREEK